MRARREAHHAMPRDDGNDGFANVLLARMNCGKHALETYQIEITPPPH
jgi:hypothetical protein